MYQHIKNQNLFSEISVTRIVKNRLFWTVSVHKSNQLNLRSQFVENSGKERYTHYFLENCPIFEVPHLLLSSGIQNVSTSLTLKVQFQTNPCSSPNGTQSINRTLNRRMTIICYHVFPSGSLALSVSIH